MGYLLVTAIFYTLLLGLKITKSAKYIFQVQVIFVLERFKLLYIYINTVYGNQNCHCCSRQAPQGSPFLSRNVGVLLLYGLIVSS